MVQFHSFACSCLVYPAPFVEKTFFYWIFFPGLWKINCLYNCGFTSGFSILFHGSLCLFLCRDHTVLTATALYYHLKSRLVMSPALFFFFKIALAIRGTLWFHTNFRTVCSSSVKNAGGILIGIVLNV